MKQYYNNNFIDVLLLFLLIATSGIEFFYLNEIWIAFGLLFVLFVRIKRNTVKQFDTKFFFILTLFVLWEFLQFIYFGRIRIRPLIGTFGRLTFAYLVLKTINYNFLKHYVNTISFLAIISLIFYLLYYVSPNFILNLIDLGNEFFTPIKRDEDLYIYNKPNLILFSFHGFEYFPKRNSGPFWEPGAFAVFLSLALVFSLLNNNKISSSKNIVLIIALLTTFSTTGYIVLFLIVLYYIYLRGKQNWILFILLPIFLFVSYNLIFKLDFLGSKIESNYIDRSTGSRFGSAMADIPLIIKNPILGYGRDINAMYGTDEFEVELMHRNNNVTKIFVQWGLIAFFYLFFIYKGMIIICKNSSNKLKIKPIFIFTILIVNAFSQSIFQYPFFYGLMFIQFIDFKLSET
jgi:hypothetical protein